MVGGGASSPAPARRPVKYTVVFYAAREALRNAAGHARVAGRPLAVRLCAAAGERFELVVEDDGRGVDAAGREGEGRGLKLHSTLMAIIGGTLTLESGPEGCTRVEQIYRALKTWRLLRRGKVKPRQVPAMLYHIGTLPLARRKLDRLADIPHDAAELRGESMPLGESEQPTPQEDESKLTSI